MYLTNWCPINLPECKVLIPTQFLKVYNKTKADVLFYKFRSPSLEMTIFFSGTQKLGLLQHSPLSSVQLSHFHSTSPSPWYSVAPHLPPDWSDDLVATYLPSMSPHHIQSRTLPIFTFTQDSPTYLFFIFLLSAFL